MSDQKICSQCQSGNEASASFCFNCGSELPSQISSQKVCRDCGVENPQDARYCASCGASFVPQHTAEASSGKTSLKSGKKRRRKNKPIAAKNFPKRKQTTNKWNPKTVGRFALGAVLFVLYFVYMNYKASKVTGDYVEQTSNNVALENNVQAVASKFVCACGSCPNEPLQSCTCVTARKERDFIRNALYNGQSAEQIIVNLNQQYGGLRAEYQPQYDSDKINLTLPSNFDSNLISGDPGGGEAGSAPASFATRMEIISHFTCPCGQCTMDELIDCDCDHPNGAKEVKQFIDQKIDEGSYTVAQLIELVENKYGGKIR